jgi:hypothetical protein
VRPAILLAFEMKARNPAEDVQPRGRVAANLDLRLGWTKRIEGLVQQVAHHARLGNVASRADIVDRQVVVDAQMALDEASHLPLVAGAVEAFEDEDVAAAGGTPIAFAVALVIRMSEGRPNGVAQCRGVTCLGSPDTVRQTSFFHAAPCVPTE